PRQGHGPHHRHHFRKTHPPRIGILANRKTLIPRRASFPPYLAGERSSPWGFPKDAPYKSNRGLITVNFSIPSAPAISIAPFNPRERYPIPAGLCVSEPIRKYFPSRSSRDAVSKIGGSTRSLKQ